MPPYEDVISTTDSYASGGGRWDAERFARERDERMYRGLAPPPVREYSRSRSRPPPPPPPAPPVFERPRRGGDRFDDRFERLVVDEDSYGPPGRRRERFVEDDDFYAARGSGPLVHRREPEPFQRPPLLRRQSSLDTFDRQPARRLDRAPPIRGVHRRPSHRRRPSGGRFTERDEYEEIDIAEPEMYGDEEFRHFRERDRPRLLREELIEEKIVEKERPYPRKGKTKMPKRLVHPRAVMQLGYPYIEEDRVIIIQKALSKELIDQVVTLSREIRSRSENVSYRRYESPSPPREQEFVERVVLASPPPVRADRLVVERSPSPYRYPSPSRVRPNRFLEQPEIVESRPRSVSVNYARAPSPVIIERRGEEEIRAGPVVMTGRPRRSANDVSEEIRALENEKKMLQIERFVDRPGTVDVIKDKTIQRRDGQLEDVLEVKQDRRPGDSRIVRAMMASLT